MRFEVLRHFRTVQLRFNVDVLVARVLGRHVFDQLVLAVVTNRAVLASVGPSDERVGLLVVSVAAFMILAIADCCEALGADLALIRLLASVRPHVHQKISFLSEDFPAVGDLALEEILA